MLDRLAGPAAAQLMNCWGISVKNVWRVPQETHRVFARFLGSGFTTIREDLLSRWVKFYQSLLSGPSPEVAAADQRTTTAENNRLVYSLTGLDARVATAAEVRTELRRRDPDMTEDEEKTAGLLCQALQARNCIWMEGLDTTGITTQIDNLCVN